MATISIEPAESIASVASLGPAARTAPRARSLSLPRGWGLAAARWAGIAGFFVLWEVLVRKGIWDKFFFGSPSLVWSKLVTWFTTGSIWPHLTITLQEVGLALSIGLVAAVVVAFALGRSHVLSTLLEPILATLNAVPRIMLAPLFIMWFGLGPASKVAVGAIMVFFTLLFPLLAGLRDVNPLYVANARLLGATPRQLDRHVYLPSTLSWLFGSLRPAIALGFTAVVVGEFLGAKRGLGFLLNSAQNTYNSGALMAGIVVLVALVTALNAAAGVIERRASVWRDPNAAR